MRKSKVVSEKHLWTKQKKKKEFGWKRLRLAFITSEQYNDTCSTQSNFVLYPSHLNSTTTRVLHIATLSCIHHIWTVQRHVFYTKQLCLVSITSEQYNDTCSTQSNFVLYPSHLNSTTTRVLHKATLSCIHHIWTVQRHVFYTKQLCLVSITSEQYNDTCSTHSNFVLYPSHLNSTTTRVLHKATLSCIHHIWTVQRHVFYTKQLCLVSITSEQYNDTCSTQSNFVLYPSHLNSTTTRVLHKATLSCIHHIWTVQRHVFYTKQLCLVSITSEQYNDTCSTQSDFVLYPSHLNSTTTRVLHKATLSCIHHIWTVQRHVFYTKQLCLVSITSEQYNDTCSTQSNFVLYPSHLNSTTTRVLHKSTLSCIHHIWTVQRHVFYTKRLCLVSITSEHHNDTCSTQINFVLYPSHLNSTTTRVLHKATLSCIHHIWTVQRHVFYTKQLCLVSITSEQYNDTCSTQSDSLHCKKEWAVLKVKYETIYMFQFLCIHLCSSRKVGVIK